MITKPRMNPAQMALRRIVSDVSSMIPRELKGDKYWHMTSDANDRFVDAVRACEEIDSPENRDAVRVTGAAWKESWRLAIQAWMEDRRS